MLQLGHGDGHAEGTRRRRQHAGEHQPPRPRIVAGEGRVGVGRADLHLHLMAAGEMGGDGRGRVAPFHDAE